uniref:Uncharacterized protein n=1 Tax=Anguilla anguilla TaxID=7936 RepID=A0A0E9TSL0_ANGAN
MYCEAIQIKYLAVSFQGN